MGRATAAPRSASGGGRSGPPRSLAPVCTLLDPITYLAGAWRLRRDIVDERTGERGRFDGVAMFSAEAHGALCYREEGDLAWPTYRGPAGRSLRYVGDGPGRARVAFADGRPFHVLELRPAGFDAVHTCGEDRYVGRFTLLSGDQWSATWRVAGPAKSLVLASSYERLRVQAGKPVSAAT